MGSSLDYCGFIGRLTDGSPKSVIISYPYHLVFGLAGFALLVFIYSLCGDKDFRGQLT